MLNLVKKDVALTKKTMLFGFIYAAIFAFAFREAAFTAGTIMLTYMLMLTSCAYDDKNRADLMLNSLPVERSTIVVAKYVSILVYAAVACVECALVSLLIRLSGIPLAVQGFNTESFVAMLAVACGFAGVFYPIFFKFGYMKTRFLNVLLFAGFFAIGGVLLLTMGGDDPFKNITVALESQPDWAIASVLAGAMLGFMLLSYMLSVRFYKRREF
jgi:ABC-2 type transport system permease protein